MAILALTSCLIVFNWGFYVWSIGQGRTLESSLGYFINPLLNVVMGYLFLGERFTTAQKLALALATVAVLVQTVALGHVPVARPDAGRHLLPLRLPPEDHPRRPHPGLPHRSGDHRAAACSARSGGSYSRGETYFGTSVFNTSMLIGCGVMTAVSLMLFAASIRRIRYSTAGLLQYISPSLVFLTAVFVFGEPMDALKLVSFVIIWVALAIFSVAAIRDERTAAPGDGAGLSLHLAEERLLRHQFGRRP